MYPKIDSISYKNGNNGVTKYGNNSIVFTENWSSVLLGTDYFILVSKMKY